jgi:DNA-binding IclR family transcriptional regulator
MSTFSATPDKRDDRDPPRPSTSVGAAPYHVPAVISAVRLLSIMADDPRTPMSQAELARDAEMSKSTAHNLLLTLEYLGYVRRDPASRRYVLGPALIALGRAASRHHALLDRAEEEATQLAATLGLEFAVARRLGDEMEIVFAAPPPSGMHISAMVGTRLGRFDGAVGKCLLADLPVAEAECAIRSAKLIPRTPATVTDPDQLLVEVRAAQDRGYATAAGEIWEIHAVVAPIYNAASELELMLLGFGFPSQLPPDRLTALGDTLRAAADRVSESGGGRQWGPLAHDRLTGRLGPSPSP